MSLGSSLTLVAGLLVTLATTATPSAQADAGVHDAPAESHTIVYINLDKTLFTNEIETVQYSFDEGRAALRRWGAHGHRLAARAAAAHLPDEMPAFFRGARGQLEYLNPEPDRWRDDGAREMNEGFRYDHYLDLELVPEEAFAARDRWEFLRALYAAGIEEPEREVGLLPFHVAELFQRLENGFRRWPT